MLRGLKKKHTGVFIYIISKGKLKSIAILHPMVLCLYAQFLTKKKKGSAYKNIGVFKNILETHKSVILSSSFFIIENKCIKIWTEKLNKTSTIRITVCNIFDIKINN